MNFAYLMKKPADLSKSNGSQYWPACFRKSSPKSAMTYAQACKGQNLLEFMALAVIVMGGVIIMGPYVIRSWNANLKGWEDSNRISHQEQMIRNTGIPLDGRCECRYVQPCGPPCCETGTCTGGEVCPPLCCGMGGCEATENTLKIYKCNPTNCDFPPKPAQCEPKTECCLKIPTNYCGINACPPPNPAPDDPRKQCCPSGQMLMRYRCADGDTFRCEPNAACNFRCLNRDPLATYCPGAQDNLPNNMQVTHYNFGRCGDALDPRCTAFCPDCCRVVNNRCDCSLPVYTKCTGCCNNNCDTDTSTSYGNPDETYVFCQPGDFRLGAPIDIGQGGDHGVEIYDDPGTGNQGCRAWEGPTNVGEEGCQIQCVIARCCYLDPAKCANICLTGNSAIVNGECDGVCNPGTCTPSINCCVNGATTTTFCPFNCICNGTCIGSTPYLFTFAENYYIENDVLQTVWDQNHEVAKENYETKPINKKTFTHTDYYQLRIHPEETPEGLKFLIKELEPEESHMDQIQLVRYIHSQSSSMIIDYQRQKIKAVEKEELPESITSCTLNSNQDCKEKLNKIDNQIIEGNKGDTVVLTLDISQLKKSNPYLTINSWGSHPLPLQKSPFEARGCGDYSLKMTISDPNDPKKRFEIKDLHPREIESSLLIDLGDIVRKLPGPTLQLEIQWTEHHYFDYIGLMTAKEVKFNAEKLPLKSALHSKNKDVLSLLLDKDKKYAHTIRGDQIELIFNSPKKKLEASETESYVFVISGFYHGLRTYLYPYTDTTDSFKKQISDYVSEVNSYLGSSLRNHKSNNR